jgi:putative DNA primase/helicase
MRSIGVAAITFNGSGWTNADFSRAIVRLKGSCEGVVVIPDNDDPGRKKASEFLEACASHSYPCLIANPLDIWAEMPEDGGDVADWIKFWKQSDSERDGDLGSGENSYYFSRINVAIAKAIENQKYKVKLETAEAILKKNDPDAYTAITSTPIAPVSEYDPSLDPDDEPVPEAEKPPALTYQEIAIQSIYGKGDYISIQESAQHSDFYQFNGKFYELLKPSHERKKIKAWAGQYWVKDPKSGRKRLKYLTTACINEIYKYALLSFEVDKEECNPDGFNLDNGILKIYWEGNTPKWRLFPHTPKAYFLHCSPVKYDPKADKTHCDTLLQCLDPLPRQILLRNLSAMFDVPKIRSLHSRPIRAGLCVGRGSNGKDSIRNILSLIFEQQLVSIGLSDFVQYDRGEKKGLKELDSARINWSSENNQETPLDKIEILNALVTGERNVLWVEDKYIRASRKNSDAIHLFNCNNTPIIKSGLKSLESRFVIYDFNKTFVDNPNPAKGELKADPRFHDDIQFQVEKVAPALLNRLLQEFAALAREGIDYTEISKGLKDLQESSTHLWSFAQDVELVEEKDGRIWISDVWQQLERWYLDNGTLEKRELYDGSHRKIWHDQPTRFDPNVTGSNQVFKRLQKLFPNISKHRETKDLLNKGKFYISGLSLKSDSQPHNPCKSSIVPSPTDSPSFTNTYSPSLPFSEGENEGEGEAKTVAVRDGEAMKQNQTKPKSVLSEIPDRYIRAGFTFRINEVLMNTEIDRFVMVREYPVNGVHFAGKYYLCESLEDGSTDWFPQKELVKA